MATLEQLVTRASRTATAGDYALLQSRLAHLEFNPAGAEALLDDEDLGILAHFGGDRAVAEAKAAIARAIAATPATAAERTTAAIAFPDEWDADTFEDTEKLNEWSLKHAMKAVPIVLWAAFVNVNRQKREALAATVEKLEQRIAELESRPVMKDCGVWKTGELYRENALVSHGGSAWVCNALHVAAGTEPSHEYFRLFVKRGRDGKDAR